MGQDYCLTTWEIIRRMRSSSGEEKKKHKRHKDAFTNNITLTRIVEGLLLKFTLSNFMSQNLTTHYFQLHSRARFHAIKTEEKQFHTLSSNLHLGLFFICNHTATHSPHSPARKQLRYFVNSCVPL